MVDLPIPSAPFVEAQNVQNRVSAGDYARSADYLGSGIDKLSAGLDNLAVPLAEQAGRDAAAKAVVRNDDGSISVDNSGSSFILGRAGEAYAHAVTLGKLAAGQTETSTAMNNLRQEHMGDPEGFQTAAGAYADSLKAKFGNNPLGASMVENANSIAAQHYNGLVNQKASLDVNKSLEAVNTQITDQKNTLQALARQGGTDTPEFQKASQNLNGLYDQLGTNPLFGVSQEKIDSEKARATSEMRGEAVVGQVDRDFNKKGKAGAQQELTDKILNNPDLHLGDAERKQLYSWGMSRLQYLSGEQQARVDANKETVNSLVSSAHSGINVPDEMWDAAMDHTQDLGDDEGWSKMDAARTASQWGRGGTGLSPQQSLDAQGIGANGGGYMGALARQENPSGSNTASPGISSALGKYQFTDSTWKSVAAAHPELNLTPDGRTDPNQQDKAIVAFTNDNKKILSNAGIEPNDKNTYLAHFMGAGGATTLIKAMQANPDAPAATLFPDAARANESIFYDKAGNTRSLSQVYALQTRRFGGGQSTVNPATPGNGVPFTREQMQENPFLMSEWVQSIAGDNTARQKAASGIGSAIETGLKNDQMPKDETLGQFFQAANLYPEKFGEQAMRIRADIEARDGPNQPLGANQGMLAQALALPRGQGQALVNAAMQASQGADIYHQQVARSFKEQWERQTKALDDNPAGEAVRRGWIANQPAPIDMSNPQSIAAGVAQRGYVSGVIASRTQSPVGPAFSKPEMPQVEQVLSKASPEVNATFAQAISALPPETRDATMAQVLPSVEAATTSSDPARAAAAFSFLDSAQRQNPNIKISADAEQNLFNWQNKFQFESPEEYARIHAALNDPTKRLARDGLTKIADESLKSVTGDQIAKDMTASKFWMTNANVPFTGSKPMDVEATSQMHAEYGKLYKDSFLTNGGDAALAGKWAAERLAKSYSVSAINDGRLMKNAPEMLYPAVGGNQDYIKSQLDDSVKQVLGSMGTKPDGPRGVSELTGELEPEYHATNDTEQEASNKYNAPRMYVPDAKTEAERDAYRSNPANAQPPSYKVIITGKNGPEVLTDKTGTAVRVFADPKAAQAEYSKKFMGMRDDNARFNSNVTLFSGGL